MSPFILQEQRQYQGPHIVDVVVEQGVQFVTTSAGDPTRYTKQLKDAGLTVFHGVPTLKGALNTSRTNISRCLTTSTQRSRTLLHPQQ